MLFHLELYRSTRDLAALNNARTAGEALTEQPEPEERYGLYIGLSGVAFALHELALASAADRWHEAAQQAVGRLCDDVILDDGCARWNGSCEYLLGSGGIGYVLLEVGGRYDERARELAIAAGKELQRVAVPSPGGVKCPVAPGGDHYMPNLSHGTAGNVMYLAALASATGDNDFQDTVLAGARYLLVIGRTTEDGFGVFHFEGAGEDHYQLGWCNGSTGLIWMFHQLHLTTGDDDWRQWRDRAAKTVLKSGIPDRRYPDFWDTVARCCGSRVSPRRSRAISLRQ